MNSPIASPAPTDDELNELAYSAHGEAMSFGLSHETFLRYFKTIRNRAQLGTGSGAEAQSDSGADSGHFARAVQSEGSTGEAPATDTQILDWLEAHFSDVHAIYVDAARNVCGLDIDCESDSLVTGDTGRIRTAIRSAMLAAQPTERAALATVEAKEKTR